MNPITGELLARDRHRETSHGARGERLARAVLATRRARRAMRRAERAVQRSDYRRD